MKRLLLFLLFAAAGVGALTWLAGGLDGPQTSQPRPKMETRTAAPVGDNVIRPGRGLPDIEAVEGITQLAPPRPLLWKDRLSGETIEIPGFIPWRFHAAEALPIKRRDEGKQAVRCTDVLFLTHRDPESRAEALALVRSDADAYKPLLHQQFRADEARVFGRLADRMQRKSSTAPEDDDTRIQLDGNVRIRDDVQATTINGDSVMVWPDQERAEGRGRFTVEHEAFVLQGSGLSMVRVKDKGWSRISIHRNPVLDLVSDVKDREGNPVFDFGPGDFRPAHITSEGRAILVREDRRRETLITITFTDRVHASQKGGRSLDADRVKLVAARSTVVPQAGEGESGWKLRHFDAEGKVSVEYPDETARGQTYIASFTADRMTHEVAAHGMPRTTLEGDPVILMRGALPLLGPGGWLRASCLHSAWIGAVPAELPTGDLPRDQLQHIALRGQARVERHGLDHERTKDVLEGDEIDLVVLQRAATEAPRSEMVATYFAAFGNVRLDGTRIQGTTHRLVGEGLHTEHPHVIAEGRGSRFVFPNLGSEQRLLGSGDAAPAEGRPSAASAAADSERVSESTQVESDERGRWLLTRVRAVGAVDIDTSMGGPAVGIPASITGHEVTYDRLSSRAQVLGPDGTPARIAWRDASGGMNVIETPRLTLDQARGVVTAEDGVRGEIAMGGRKGRQGGFGARRTRGAPAGRAGTTLSLRTDARIDIDLASTGTSLKPQPGAEQRVRIDGPVVTELRNADMAVDRMQSDSLEVGMVFSVEPAADDAASSTPTSNSVGRSGAPSNRTPAAGNATPDDAAPPERFEIEAGEMRAHLVDGEVRTIHATGNVDMRAKSGHVTGARLTYDATTGSARVFASQPDWTSRPATAILGDTEQRTEIRGAQLAMSWVDGVATAVEARAPQGTYADIHMYSRDAKRPGRLERYALLYWGRMDMTPTALRAGRVRLIRRIREAPDAAWGPPAALYAATLRVEGSNMLSADDERRDMRRIVAEGPETMFRSGADADLIRAWGHQFDYDVKRKTATIRGRNGSDVTIQTGETVHIDQSEITIDMKTNLPTYVRGGRIVWTPPRKKTPK